MGEAIQATGSSESKQEQRQSHRSRSSKSKERSSSRRRPRATNHAENNETASSSRTGSISSSRRRRERNSRRDDHHDDKHYSSNNNGRSNSRGPRGETSRTRRRDPSRESTAGSRRRTRSKDGVRHSSSKRSSSADHRSHNRTRSRSRTRTGTGRSSSLRRGDREGEDERRTTTTRPTRLVSTSSSSKQASRNSELQGSSTTPHRHTDSGDSSLLSYLEQEKKNPREGENDEPSVFSKESRRSRPRSRSPRHFPQSASVMGGSTLGRQEVLDRRRTRSEGNGLLLDASNSTTNHSDGHKNDNDENHHELSNRRHNETDVADHKRGTGRARRRASMPSTAEYEYENGTGPPPTTATTTRARRRPSLSSTSSAVVTPEGGHHRRAPRRSSIGALSSGDGGYRNESTGRARRRTSIGAGSSGDGGYRNETGGRAKRRTSIGAASSGEGGYRNESTGGRARRRPSMSSTTSGLPNTDGGGYRNETGGRAPRRSSMSHTSSAVSNTDGGGGYRNERARAKRRSSMSHTTSAVTVTVTGADVGYRNATGGRAPRRSSMGSTATGAEVPPGFPVAAVSQIENLGMEDVTTKILDSTARLRQRQSVRASSHTASPHSVQREGSKRARRRSMNMEKMDSINRTSDHTERTADSQTQETAPRSQELNSPHTLEPPLTQEHAVQEQSSTTNERNPITPSSPPNNDDSVTLIEAKVAELTKVVLESPKHTRKGILAALESRFTKTTTKEGKKEDNRLSITTPMLKQASKKMSKRFSLKMSLPSLRKSDKKEDGPAPGSIPLGSSHDLDLSDRGDSNTANDADNVEKPQSTLSLDPNRLSSVPVAPIKSLFIVEETEQVGVQGEMSLNDMDYKDEDSRMSGSLNSITRQNIPPSGSGEQSEGSLESITFSVGNSNYPNGLHLSPHNSSTRSDSTSGSQKSNGLLRRRAGELSVPYTPTKKKVSWVEMPMNNPHQLVLKTSDGNERNTTAEEHIGMEGDIKNHQTQEPATSIEEETNLKKNPSLEAALDWDGREERVQALDERTVGTATTATTINTTNTNTSEATMKTTNRTPMTPGACIAPTNPTNFGHQSQSSMSTEDVFEGSKSDAGSSTNVSRDTGSSKTMSTADTGSSTTMSRDSFSHQSDGSSSSISHRRRRHTTDSEGSASSCSVLSQRSTDKKSSRERKSSKRAPTRDKISKKVRSKRLPPSSIGSDIDSSRASVNETSSTKESSTRSRSNRSASEAGSTGSASGTTSASSTTRKGENRKMRRVSSRDEDRQKDNKLAEQQISSSTSKAFNNAVSASNRTTGDENGGENHTAASDKPAKSEVRYVPVKGLEPEESDEIPRQLSGEPTDEKVGSVDTTSTDTSAEARGSPIDPPPAPETKRLVATPSPPVSSHSRKSYLPRKRSSLNRAVSQGQKDSVKLSLDNALGANDLLLAAAELRAAREKKKRRPPRTTKSY